MGWYSDGCCMFWKQSVFTLVSEYRGQYPENNQVYLLTALRHKQTTQDIVVAVTHLRAQQNQTNELIRCRQADALRDRIDQMVARVQKNNSQRRNDPSSSSPDIPVLILGDFNADPPWFQGCCGLTIVDRRFGDWLHAPAPYSRLERHVDITQLSLVLSH
jgi:endonuclease/exonuclease/phosphatase family metal-dependent hydrolase